MRTQKVTELVEQTAAIVKRIRTDDEYIAQAVAHGKMNPKLRAICIGHAENWQWLSRFFPDLQMDIDGLTGEIKHAVMPVEGNSTIVLQLDVVRAFKKAGIHIAVEVDVDNDAMPVSVYGVFDVRPDLKFAI